MRSLSSSLIQSLMEEEPFKYAHLVKFEKPIKTESGKSTRAANSYSYITDASIDISYDDNSLDVRGVSNGEQIYVANRLLDVSGISETIEARASNFSITIGATALNTTYSGLITIAFSTNYTITSAFSFVELGFLEGDEITVGATPSFTARIDRFTNSNKTATLTILSGTPTVGNFTLNVTLSSKDVTALLLDKTSSSYARYINREIFVYKAHINTTTGAIIGDPYLLFKGIITSGSLTEDVQSGSKMVWNISSHWGDWVRVNGRLTSDSHHRALNNQGFSDRAALIRPEYADDLGFLHAEQALNIISTYKVKETRYKTKKSGLFGLKTKLKEYQVLVDREVDLRFNLEAKYLPVVYGVQRLDTIPFFVDTDSTQPNKVYAAYAICEGEIAGIYDIYFGDQSSVCLDANDESTRSVTSAVDTVDVLCSGRADRGDVLSSQDVDDLTNVQLAQAISTAWGLNTYIAPSFNREFFGVKADFTGAVAASPQSAGILHEKGRSFTDPIDVKFTIHTGKYNQKPDTILMNMAQSGSFKVQGDFYEGDKSQYWGPNHRVLDTAYAVAEFTLSEGEEEIPEVEFVVKGKILECYNYDYSYIHDPNPTYSAETTSNLQIGDIVTLNKTDTGSPFNTSAVIADIYTDEFARTRVRFLEDPTLGSVTGFYITGRTTSPADPDYHLVTTDHNQHSGIVASTLKETVVSTIPTVDNTYDININAGTALGNGIISLPDMSVAVGGAGLINWDSIKSNFTPEQLYQFEIALGSSSRRGTGSTTTTIKQVSSTTNETTYTTVVSKNGIKLSNSASATSGVYNGYIIELTRTNIDGSTYVQTRTITDYSGVNRQAVVDKDWDPLYIPTNNSADTPTPSFIVQDSYRIYPPDDSRVSNNPAIQLLDYITSDRYGRGLDIDTDINLESFKEAARKCDTRSDVTVALVSGATAPAIGDVYQHVINGKRLFRGKVSEQPVSSNGLWEVTFTDVIGKLGKKWVDWKSYGVGDLVWNKGYAYRVVTAGIITPEPTGAGALGSVALTRVSGTGPSSLSLDLTKASFDGNPLIKKYVSFTKSYISGYSLYDCDDVKYWRYVGWNEQNQNYVTRHQTNIIVNTSNSVFDNINMLLGHFNGILRYNAGKYELDVEGQHSSTTGVYGYSQADIDLASWTTTSSLTTSIASIAGPVGGYGTVLKLTEAATSPSVLAHVLRSKVFTGISDNEVIVGSAYLKAGTYTSGGLRVLLKNNATAAVSFDLTGNGNYKLVANTLAAGIYSVGDGWYRCWMAANVGDSAVTTPRFDIAIDNTFADSSLAYSSSFATNYIYASSAKVEFNRYFDYQNGPTPYIYYPNVITEEDIIGAISVEDPGNKDTYNTISIDIPDPRNRFEERSVTYFNSTYLIEDNNVPKKGDMKSTGITNYFNARMNAKQYLEQSRYGLKISFTMPPKGILITAGSIIEITNSRLGFISKPFRVTNITINKDCLVQINADEHTNEAYSVIASSIGAFAASEPVSGITANPDPVTSPTASITNSGGIVLNWNNPTSFNPFTDFVQIWRGDTSLFSDSPAPTLLNTVKYVTSYTDPVLSVTNKSYYYWFKVVKETYKKSTNTIVQLSSIFAPDTSIIPEPTGILGTSLANFSSNNDSNSLSPTNPTILSDGSAIDHVINTDGSADISFEWQYSQGSPLAANNVDGFIVYVKSDLSSSPYAFGTSPNDEATYTTDPTKRSVILYGVPANKYYTFGVRGYRVVNTDISSTGTLLSNIVRPSLGGESPSYRPSANVAFAGDVTGTIAGSPAANVVANAALGAAVYSNFNTNNDNNPISPTAPTLLNTDETIDHVINTDGSADISFEWNYTQGSPLAANNVDGFIVYVKSSISPNQYTFGTSPRDEVTFTVDSSRRAFVLQGVAANRYYKFGIQGYRVVNTNIHPNGILLSNITSPAYSESSPTYRPSANVAFAGDVTGTIAGSPATTVVGNALSGLAAFNGTINYRTAGAPTNIPSPSGITGTANSNGSYNIRLDWNTYVQGANYADTLLIFWRKDGNAPTISDACVLSNVNVLAPSYFTLEGVNPSDTYSFGIAAGRKTENGIEIGAIQAPTGTPDWRGVTGGTANYTANIDGSPASQVRANASLGAAVYTNFQSNNDRNGLVPTDPVVSPNGFAIDHVVNKDGSADISFEWEYTVGSPDKVNNVDGFIVYVKSNGSPNSAPYIFNTSPLEEVTYTVDATRRSFILQGVPADRFYTFGIRAYRAVDTDIDATGVKLSNIIKSSLAGENPYRPETNVAFSGNVTGTIDGDLAATVRSGAALGATVYNNYNAENDQNSTPVTAPTVTNTSADISAVLNQDNTCDVTFNWSYNIGSPLTASSIDGFVIYLKSNDYPNPYTFTGGETAVVIPAASPTNYSYTFKGLQAAQWHNIAVRAYRVVSATIINSGVLYSNYTQTSYNNSSGITSTAYYPVGIKRHMDAISPLWDNKFISDDYTTWTKFNSTVNISTTELAPDLKTYSYEITETNASGNHGIGRVISSPTIGKVTIFKGFVKPKGDSRGINLRFGTGSYGGVVRNFRFEPSPLQTIPEAAGYFDVRPLSNGWYELFAGYTATGTSPVSLFLLGTNTTTTNYLGASPSGLYAANLAAYEIDSITNNIPNLQDVVGSTWYSSETDTLSTWNGSRWIASSTKGAPVGTLVGGTLAETVETNASLGAAVYSNFNTNNDANALSPTDPTVSNTINTIDHVINTDGSADISFEWGYTQGSPLAANNVDGFIVYVRSSLSSSPYAFGTSPNDEVTFTVPQNKRAFVLQGVPADRYYKFGIQGYRVVNTVVNPNGVLLSNIISPAYSESSPTYRPTAQVAFNGDITGTINGDPVGIVVANASLGAAAYSNFSTDNDNNALSPTAPTLLNTADTIDHVINTDGSADISFEWNYTLGSPLAVNNVDGFIVYVKSSISPNQYSFGTSPRDEVTYTVDSSRRAFVLQGVPADRYYKFGIQGYRVVNTNIHPNGILLSNITSPAYSESSPTYRPSANVAFAGDVTGTIAGSPASTVVANVNTTFSGTVKYRTSGEPTNLVTPLNLSVTNNNNGTKNIRVSWDAYSQGTNQADVLGLFYRTDNNTPTYIDSCILMNVNTNIPGYYDLPGINPTQAYSFGIAAGRRTENGIEWGLINTTYGTSPYYLYGNDIIGGYSPTSLGPTTVSPLSILTASTPSGERAYRVTDVNTNNYNLVSNGSVIDVSPTSNRWQAEAWIRRDVGATTHHGLLRLSSYIGVSPSTSDVLIRYTDGTILFTTSTWPTASPQAFVEAHIKENVTWYKVGISGNVSPNTSSVYVDFYPAVGSPAALYTPSPTGDGTIGGVTLRKRTVSNTGFDWTNITADAAVNFTGNITSTSFIAGSPASEVASNAVSGVTAFTGTLKYRTDGAPTNVPTPSGITGTANPNGSYNIRLDWNTYTQGANQADVLLIFWRRDGNAPTINDACIVSNVNAAASYYTFEGVNPSDTYSFGIAAARRTESGLQVGAIQAPTTAPDWRGVTGGTANYIANINNTPATTITAAIVNFNTSNDRNGLGPTAPTVTNTSADFAPITLNTDGTCNITFNWQYTQGSPDKINNVDGFVLYTYASNYPANYSFTGSETSYVVQATSASSYSYIFTGLPSHKWHHFGVRGYRVVDSDISNVGVLYSAIVESTYNNTGINSTAQFPIGTKTNVNGSAPVWDNLFTTDDYRDAYWSKTNSTVNLSSTVLAPDGKTYSYEIIETNIAGSHGIFRALSPSTVGKYFVVKLFAKAKGNNRGVYVRYGTNAFGGVLRNWQIDFSPALMAFPGSGAGHGSVRALANDWYEIYVAYPIAASPSTNFFVYSTDSTGAVSYTGASPNGMYLSNIAAYEVDAIIGQSPGLPSTMDVVGSTWYDTVNRSFKVWNGSRWIESSTLGATPGVNLLTPGGSPVSNLTDGSPGVYIGHSVIKIYDASSVLRVKIGNLSL